MPDCYRRQGIRDGRDNPEIRVAGEEPDSDDYQPGERYGEETVLEVESWVYKEGFLEEMEKKESADAENNCEDYNGRDDGQKR